MNFLERNSLPRSERTTVPDGFRLEIAICNAATASEERIRESME